MNELHLFAGAGGGILGGILLGHTTVCAVEIEPYCRKVLHQRQRDGILPKFPIWDDVCTFDGTPWRGKVDVVCGGFPCQDISSAGGGLELKGKEVVYGNKWLESLVKYDLDTHSWKTHRCLWSEDLPWLSVTLPKWGMTHRGELLERIMLEQTTTEKGYGFWPTPVASECRDTWSKPESLAKLYKGDRVARFLCKSWLTSNSMPERVALNPCWQEERMMWPIGQSALKPLATDKFRLWLQQHGEFLEENKDEIT